MLAWALSAMMASIEAESGQGIAALHFTLNLTSTLELSAAAAAAAAATAAADVGDGPFDCFCFCFCCRNSGWPGEEVEGPAPAAAAAAATAAAAAAAAAELCSPSSACSSSAVTKRLAPEMPSTSVSDETEKCVAECQISVCSSLTFTFEHPRMFLTKAGASTGSVKWIVRVPLFHAVTSAASSYMCQGGGPGADS